MEEASEDTEEGTASLAAGDVDRAEVKAAEAKATITKAKKKLATPAKEVDTSEGKPKKSVNDGSKLEEQIQKLDDERKKLDKGIATHHKHSGCDGVDVCVFGGVLAASYSLTVGQGDRVGQTGHRIVNLAIPEGGIRWAPLAYVSLDLALYTSIISPQFQANSVSTVGSGCSKTQSAFNDALPCEGNTALRPYGALLIGATVGTGKSSLGIITVGYTIGFARTTQDANAFWFQGFMIGTAGVYKTVPLSITDTDQSADSGGQEVAKVSTTAKGAPGKGTSTAPSSAAPKPVPAAENSQKAASPPEKSESPPKPTPAPEQQEPPQKGGPKGKRGKPAKTSSPATSTEVQP